jgi:serine protease Do
VTVTPSIVASYKLDVERGVLVTHADPTKLAAVSGLEVGDVVTAIDNRPIHNLGDFWHNYLAAEDQSPAKLAIYGKSGQAMISLPRFPRPTVSR